MTPTAVSADAATIIAITIARTEGAPSARLKIRYIEARDSMGVGPLHARGWVRAIFWSTLAHVPDQLRARARDRLHARAGLACSTGRNRRRDRRRGRPGRRDRDPGNHA